MIKHFIFLFDGIERKWNIIKIRQKNMDLDYTQFSYIKGDLSEI